MKIEYILARATSPIRHGSPQAPDQPRAGHSDRGARLSQMPRPTYAEATTMTGADPKPADRASAADQWLTPGRFALLLGLLIFAAFPAVVLGGRTFVIRDFGLFSYPVAHFHRQCFWQGELPLWNPLSHCGLPFLAQWNTLALYPLSLIYLLLPLTWSLSFFCLAHLFWGGLGMYFLAHRWTNDRLAAGLAGVIFAFNGLSLNFLMWPSHVATSVLPDTAALVDQETTPVVQTPPPVVVTPSLATPVPIEVAAVDTTNLPHLFIVAHKYGKSADLFLRDDTLWRKEKTFSIAIGEQQGRKVRAGDKRTPEGLYFITGRRERSELNIIYGPMVFVLNYPNKKDVSEGRTGQGIWLHGTSPDSMPVQTQGCLEFRNEDMVVLSRYLGFGIGIPVLILADTDSFPSQHHLEVFDWAELTAQRKEIIGNHASQSTFFAQHLAEWKLAWESRDIGRYAHYYDTTAFYGQGMHWSEWRDKKIATFEKYAHITILVERLILTDFSENQAVVKFIQTYESDVNQITNGKKIVFVLDEGQWKISQENTFPQEELLL